MPIIGRLRYEGSYKCIVSHKAADKEVESRSAQLTLGIYILVFTVHIFRDLSIWDRLITQLYGGSRKDILKLKALCCDN